jgi:7-cyano-7-deazaguanine synthase in queuosine biosynthesis
MKIGMLVTGGMDSTAMMYMAMNRVGLEIHPITVDYEHSAFYKQKALVEWHIEELRRRKLEATIKTLQNIDVQFHHFQRHSEALFDPTYKCEEVDPLKEWDKMRYEKELVEGRNAIMVLYALGYCASMQLDELWAGYLYSEEEWKHRFSVKLLLGDNSPQFVDTMNTLSMMGFSRPTRFRAPFYEQRLSKEDVFLIGRGYSIDYSKTHSCYFPVPCNKCDNCLLRNDIMNKYKNGN